MSIQVFPPRNPKKLARARLKCRRVRVGWRKFWQISDRMKAKEPLTSVKKFLNFVPSGRETRTHGRVAQLVRARR